jgi:hypothetical protein
MDAEAFTLNDAQVAAVRTGLQLLSSTCDGARRTDGAGFNKFDSDIGKDLASKPFLSMRQTVLGRRLLRKYQRQLPAEMVALLWPEVA